MLILFNNYLLIIYLFIGSILNVVEFIGTISMLHNLSTLIPGSKFISIIPICLLRLESLILNVRNVRKRKDLSEYVLLC